MSGIGNIQAQNNNVVRDVIRRSENPHPLTIFIIVFVVVFFLYCCHIKYNKNNLSGVWENTKGKAFHVVYNRLNNKVIVYCLEKQIDGIVSGDAIILNIDGATKKGICINNRIEWQNGDVWTKKYSE